MNGDVDVLDSDARVPGIAPTAAMPEFWSNVERWEASAWNRPGSDKSWVDRLLSAENDWGAAFVRDEPRFELPVRLFRELAREQILYLVIGVGGAHMHAREHGGALRTKDLDLFLPPDPHNLLACWQACERVELTLWADQERLDVPRDLWLARRVVEQRARTTATFEGALPIDLTFAMGSLDFEDVWLRRRRNHSENAAVELARLSDILESKRQANREKDRVFLQENRALLDRLLRDEPPPAMKP
jgi:hypothetical protein